MFTRLRNLSSSLDQWVLTHRGFSVVMGSLLVAAAVLMIFLAEFDVITGPLQYVAYLFLGLGGALILLPRRLPPHWDPDEPTT